MVGTSFASSLALWVPSTIARTDFSAIYMAKGYTKYSVQSQVEMTVLQYLGDQQPLWQPYFDQDCPIQFRDLSLVVILETYRAETWTFAAGTKLFLETKKEPLTLEQLSSSRYTWKTEDSSIRCEYGPKEAQQDKLEQYISQEKLRSNLSDGDCRKIRQCHCVAVRACTLTKPRSRIAASINSFTSGKSRSRLQLHKTMSK